MTAQQAYFFQVISCAVILIWQRNRPYRLEDEAERVLYAYQQSEVRG